MKENPEYPISDWKWEVRDGYTWLGYKEWVEHKIESDQEEQCGK